jgi:hypothetical protein
MGIFLSVMDKGTLWPLMSLLSAGKRFGGVGHLLFSAKVVERVKRPRSFLPTDLFLLLRSLYGVPLYEKMVEGRQDIRR